MQNNEKTGTGVAINLFYNIAEHLTDLEKATLVPRLVELLSNTNTSKRITGRKICEWFCGNGFPVSQQRLCKMVAFIRTSNMVSPKVLIGAGNGYFITEDSNEIANQIESFEGRIDAMNSVVDALKAQKLSVERMKQTG
jgi:hypothetical protein